MKLNKFIAVVFLMLSGWVAGAQTAQANNDELYVYPKVGGKCHTGGASARIVDGVSEYFECKDHKWVKDLTVPAPVPAPVPANQFTCLTGCVDLSLSNFTVYTPNPEIKIDSPIEDTKGTVHYAFHAEKGWSCKTIPSADNKTLMFICTVDEPKPEPPVNNECIKPAPSFPMCPLNSTCQVINTFTPIPVNGNPDGFVNTVKPAVSTNPDWLSPETTDHRTVLK